MKRRMSIWIAVFAVAAALGVYLVAIAQTGESAYQTIKPEETRRRFENGGNGLYVDVRTQAEYDEAHIPGALLLPLDGIGDDPPATLADFERELYVYCRTGVRSREASEKLLALGYQNVYDMGGIVSWPYEKVSTAEEQAVAQPEQTAAGVPEATPETEEAGGGQRFLESFTATDLGGNAVDQSLFKNYKLTMINIWATYCGPCLTEMPDLGKLSEAYRDKGVQIVGIVSDAQNYDGSISEEQAELAREIVEKTGAAYPHLLPSEDLGNIVLWQVSAVPTTVFVDSNGSLVGYAYMGAADYDTWAERIETTLGVL